MLPSGNFIILAGSGSPDPWNRIHTQKYYHVFFLLAAIMVYTTSSLFLRALSLAGITHVFVNWGSDHPAMLEELQRQRSQGERDTSPRVVTCPNEMVALSAAQGYAQVTGKPAAVIIHVDVGTQVRILLVESRLHLSSSYLHLRLLLEQYIIAIVVEYRFWFMLEVLRLPVETRWKAAVMNG